MLFVRLTRENGGPYSDTLTLNAAASAPTCKDYIVGIITILISNEQL